MNSTNNTPPLDPDLEVRIVALVLGEASEFERDQLMQIIAQRPEVASLHARVEMVHGLLAEAGKGEAFANDHAWKLPSHNREQLLAVLLGEKPASSLSLATPETEKPPVTASSSTNKRNYRRIAKLVIAASVAFIVIGLGSTLLLSSRKEQYADIASLEARMDVTQSPSSRSGDTRRESAPNSEGASYFERDFETDVLYADGSITGGTNLYYQQQQSRAEPGNESRSAWVPNFAQPQSAVDAPSALPELRKNVDMPEPAAASATPFYRVEAQDFAESMELSVPQAEAEVEEFSIGQLNEQAAQTAGADRYADQPMPQGSTRDEFEVDRFKSMANDGPTEPQPSPKISSRMAVGGGMGSGGSAKKELAFGGGMGGGMPPTSGDTAGDDGLIWNAPVPPSAGPSADGFAFSDPQLWDSSSRSRLSRSGGASVADPNAIVADREAATWAELAPTDPFGNSAVGPAFKPTQPQRWAGRLGDKDSDSSGLQEEMAQSEFLGEDQTLLEKNGRVDELKTADKSDWIDRSTLEQNRRRLERSKLLETDVRGEQTAELLGISEQKQWDLEIAGSKAAFDSRADGVPADAGLADPFELESLKKESGVRVSPAGPVVKAKEQAGKDAVSEKLAEPQSKPESEVELKRKMDRRSVRQQALIETAAAEEPFSTFSLHVSDVSFKLAQAALAGGNYPEPDKVRIEEFVNAFDYGDPLPSQSEAVACRVEQCVHPFMQQRNLLRVSMRTAAAGRSSSTPLRLTFLLDNSGSMERFDRQQTVRRAFAMLAAQLRPDDVVSLISFARTTRLLTDRVNGTSAAELVQLVDNLPSEGGTNIEAGLQLAFEKAREQRLDGAQNRIVLLTDGAVNLGDANPESLAQMIVTMRDAGIAFDAAGIGADGLNDEVLEALARKGDGRYYLLDSEAAADDGFAKQIAGALRPAAKNVKVQVEFNPNRVRHYKLLGFEKHLLNQEDFRNDAIDAAEMAAAEAGVAVYQFEAMPDGAGDVGSVSVRFRDLSTGQMVENRWPIPYRSDAPRIEEASPSMQVAATAALFAAKLKGDPLGESVRLKTLAEVIAGISPSGDEPQTRISQLQQMIQQARQISGE
jgi:Mg-chelatase subunit ChlD